MSTIRLTIDHDGTEFVTESTVDDDPSLPDMLAGVHAAGVAWLEAGARIAEAERDEMADFVAASRVPTFCGVQR